MRIAILGCKGIPNEYSGFEQCAQLISVGLVKRGHEVVVYNSHFHSYKENSYMGVKIRRKYSPESILGGSANFIYDFLCLKEAIKENYDIIVELGYGTLAPSLLLLRSKCKIVVNMDGMEWKRSNWNYFTRKLLKYFESLTVKRADHLIADNIGIKNYLKEKYKVSSYFIPYSTKIFENPNDIFLKDYNLKPNNYHVILARLIPENNTEMIIKSFSKSSSDKDLIIIGNTNTKFGTYLLKNYGSKSNIRFMGPIFNRFHLDNIRYYSCLYFHGHSVGGTNPSLLEAMSSGALVIAHSNTFNRNVLGPDAIYFENENELDSIFSTEDKIFSSKEKMASTNIEIIKSQYTDKVIIDMYENMFEDILKSASKV